MSFTTEIENQIQALTDERQGIVDTFTRYNQKISSQIEKILRDADVFDVVYALEMGREAQRVTEQDRVNQLTAKIADLRLSLTGVSNGTIPDQLDQ